MLAYSHIALRINKLQKEIKERFALTWTEYLILCAIANLSESDQVITPIDVHNELGHNKRWTYKSIDNLVEKKLIRIGHETESWNPGGIRITYGGDLVLKAAERIMGNAIHN